MSGAAVTAAFGSMTRTRDGVRDAAAVLLLLLLSLAWSGGNLVLAFASGPGPGQDYMVASSAPAEPVGPEAALSEGQLAGAVSQAKADWLAVRPSADLSSVSFSIADLSGLALGATAGSSVTIDVDAAGWGWQAMDLTTVVRHEIGHVLGLEHGSGLMSSALAPGSSYGVGSEYAEPEPEPTTELAGGAAGTTDTEGTESTESTETTQVTESTETGTDTGPEGSGSTDPGAQTDSWETTSEEESVEPMTMPEPVSGPSTTGLSTTSLELGDESETMSFAIVSTGGPTAGDDVITVVDMGGGAYSLQIGGVEFATVSGGDTVTVDALDGSDVLVGPDVASIWGITGVNAGTLELPSGAKIEFSNIESLTGAATASDEFRFDEQAGLTGAVDDGAGQLTVTVAGFVRVVGDYGFVREAYTATLNGGGTVAANLLKLGGTAGGGFVGVEVLGASVGVSGSLSSFTLAVIAAGEQAWHAFTGTMVSPTIGGVLGLDLDMNLDTLSVSVNTSSKDDSWLDLSASPITNAGTPTLAFDSELLSATVPVLLDLGGFIFVNGDVTITKGGPTSVDISTGLGGVDESLIPAALKDATKVPMVTADPTDGSLGRSADYGTLWNLEVSALQFAFTAANAFVGHGFGWDVSTDADGVLDQAEVGTNAVGIFAGGINLVMVLLTPLGAMPISQRFLALKGSVGSIGLVGLDDVFTLDVDELELEVNRGPSLATGAGPAVVDWVSSFPDPDTSDAPVDPYEEDPTPAGYRPFVGGPSPPSLVIDATSSVFGVSATRAVVTIADFVHIGARFSLQQGATEYVDVEIENLAGLGKTQLESSLTSVSATDPGGTTLGRNSDTTRIWNLPVKTLLVGLSDASLFVGYNPGGFDPAQDLPLAAGDLDADALGLLATGLTLGLVVASPIRTAFTAANLLPTFVALRADLASLTPIGLPSEFVLSFAGIRFELNRGGMVVGGGLTSIASVDWAGSFPGSTPGLQIPAGRSDDSSGSTVLIDFTAPLLRVSATRVVLAVSDFVYISGGFAFEPGTRVDADVDTAGVSGGGLLADAINAGQGDQATDPADGSTRATENATTIWNLPVTTTMFGISNGSVFIGYNPDLQGSSGTSFSTGGDAILDEGDLSDDAVGFLANDIDIAMVFASVVPDVAKPWLSQLPRRFWSLKASVGLLVPVGLPDEFVLRFEGVALAVNSGGPVNAVTTSAAWINWTKTFPDSNGDTAPPAGLRVATAPTEAVYIDFEDPVFGVSATRVVLAISDFVYISGGFAFEKGARHSVNLDTAGLGSGSASPGGLLATAVNGLAGAQATDPEDGSTRATANATTIWNVPISTTTFGIANGSIFVGYNPNLQGTSGTSFNTGSDTILDEADLGSDAIGFLANNINVGLVFAHIEKDPLKAWMAQLPDTVWALKASVGLLKPIGLPSEFELEFVGVMLTINKAGMVTGAVGAETWVNWATSLPDSDSDTPPPAGLPVATGTGNTPVYVDFEDPIFGISATRVTIAISDFVYISGGFAFEQGGRVDADIRTSGMGPAGTAYAALVNGGSPASATDPSDGSTKATANGSTIWNVPVVTTLIGVSDASVFIGYNPNAAGSTGTSFDPGPDGRLDEVDLSDDAIGLLANGVSVGIVLAKVEPISTATWDDQLPTFYAVRAEIALLTPVGLPDELVFRFEDVALTLNQGGKVGASPSSNAWIDWAASLPDPDGNGPLRAGLEVPTGQGNPPVWIDFDDPIIGVSAGRVVISIYNFVHISGGFAFEKGGQETVNINTGLVLLGPDAATCALLTTAALAATADGVTLSSDCKTLSGVTIETIKVGVHQASIFVGYNPSPVCPEGATSCPVFDTGDDGVLQADELDEGAIGFLGSGIDVGFVFASILRGPFTQALGEKAPTFYAVKAHVADLGLVGVNGIILNAKGATVEANAASKWTGGEGAHSPPSINWKTSLPDPDNPGLEIPTGGSNPSVYLDFEGFLIGGGANQFTLKISEFIYLSGSFYFEYGVVRTMPLTDGIISTQLLQDVIAESGIPDLGTFIGLTEKELQFLTIGAQDVKAFVGLGGPYWVDDNGNGVIDDGETTTNPDAVGLVLDDVDFAMAMMTPTNRLDPMRYLALQASAAQVALVGIDGLTVSAKGIEVELNISTPTLYGLPVLPVVDFAGYDADSATAGHQPFSVKVGAPAESGGDPIVVPFTYATALIRALAADIHLDVFGVLALRGSVAFELGRSVDVTLADGTPVTGVTTMTIGGANLLGFVGLDGPSWQTDSNGDVVWVDPADGVTPCTPTAATDCKAARNPAAIGVAIEDLDFGIFVGVKADPTNPAVYVAADVRVDSFGLVGLPDGFTLGGTLAIALNLGLVVGASTSLSAINFKESFHYDPDGEQGTAPATSCTPTDPDWAGEDPDCDDLPGFAVPTGNSLNPVVLDFEKTFVSVEVAGVLALGTYLAADGVFYLDISDEGLSLLVVASLQIGPDVGKPDGGRMFDAGAIGVVVINGDGVAADLNVELTIGNSSIGLALSAEARLILNTAGVDMSLEIPDTLWGFLQDLKLGLSPTGGTLTPPSGTDSMTGEFLDRLVDCDAADSDPADDRCYVISGKAPKLIAASDVDESTINALLGRGGTIVPSPTAGAYLTVVLDGRLTIVGFADARGLLAVSLSGSAFEMVASVTFQLGATANTALNVRAEGVLGLYDDGVFMKVDVGLKANLLSLFDLDVSGELEIDTTKNDGTERDDYFHVKLDGSVKILRLISLNGHLDIAVSGGKWAVQAGLSGKFGPLSMHANGFILSTGTFSFDLGGNIDLTIAGTGIKGYLSAHASFCNHAAGLTSGNNTCTDVKDPSSSAFGGADATRNFRITLTGGVDVKLFGVTLAGAEISFYGEANLGGQIKVKAKFTVKILFVKKSVTITVADFRLPVSLVNAGSPPPKLATLQSGGVLRLNVGDFADQRGVSQDETAEEYVVRRDGSDIVISAFGYEERFSGVTRIEGDFGSDDDAFIAFNDLNIPVVLYGGAGNDFLAYSSSAGCTSSGYQAQLYGGAGDDDLRGGSCNDYLDGGIGHDYLDGGAGIDTMIGGDGNDTFFGYINEVMSETVQAGAGTDTFELVGTPGADTMTVGVHNGGVRIGYGSGNLDLTQFEKLVLRTQGGDSLTLSGALNTVGIQDVSIGFGMTHLAPNEATVCTDAMRAADPNQTACTDTVTVLGGGDTVTVNLLETGDILTVTGSMAAPLAVLSRGSGALLVEDDPSESPTPVPTTMVSWQGNYTLTLSGSSLDTGDRDQLNVNMLGGDDLLRLASLQIAALFDLGAGADVARVGSLAAGSHTGGTLDGIAAPLDIAGGSGTDTLDVDDSGDAAANTGTLTNNLLSGLGLHSEGLGYTGVETLNIRLGGGADEFTIVSTSSTTTTTLRAGAGDDTILVESVSGPTFVHGDAGADLIRIRSVAAPLEVDGGGGNDAFWLGSLAPSLNGVLDLIAAYVKLDGGAGTDSLHVDDSGDTTSNIGYLTADRIAGLGMSIDTGHTAAKPAWAITVVGGGDGGFTINLGGGKVTGPIPFDADPKVVEDAINDILGAGTVSVSRSPLTRGSGTTYLIRWTGSLTGAPPVPVITVNPDSTLVASGGTTTIQQMSDGYVDHLGFETLTLLLGSGDDLLDVDSTSTGATTKVYAGNGDDVLTVETIAGPTQIYGDAGADSISVNALPDLPATTNGIGPHSLLLTGGAGSDDYTIQLFSHGSSRIDVVDGVGSADGGSNTLTVNGSVNGDTFLLRKGLVAALNTPLPHAAGHQLAFAYAEVVTYGADINAGLVVNGLEGDDVFAVDDNSTVTTLNGGAGDDSFHVGQLYGEGDGNISFATEFTPTLTDTTRGMLSNGVSYATTINGGSDDDTFQILRNVAVLQLNGESGDDTFIVRTFLKEGDDTSDATTGISSGDGTNVVQYVVNAPVSIDGGTGFDTLVLIGTEADDVFVITKDGIWGAGRYVTFVGVEKVDIDGAEGDDLFIVVSTNPDVLTRIFGGLGSDTILVGSAAPIVVADDLRGHSGIIEHSVESTLGNWTGIPVDGVVAEIADDEEASVIISPTNGGLVVRERDGLYATYTVTLTRVPTGTVSVTVVAPNLSPDDLAARSRNVEVSKDGVNWAKSTTLSFDAGTLQHTVYVRAIDDLSAEGERYVVLQHLVEQLGGEYEGLPMLNAVVRVVDNDQAGVTVIAGKPVKVTEGGNASSYTIELNKAPAGDVKVTIDPDSDVQVSVDNGATWHDSVTVTITAANWDTPLTVLVRAVDDSDVEGYAFSSITHTITTGDGGAYTSGMVLDTVSVLVADNDTPTIQIIESDGDTVLAEDSGSGLFLEDSYDVVLTSNPGVGNTVTVTVHARPTKTLNGAIERNNQQVVVSTDGGATWGSTATLTFDSTNWDTPQTVLVRAIDDSVIDGSDYQAFTSSGGSFGRTHQIQGPLYVFGGDDPEGDRTIPRPVMLPGEFTEAPVTTPNPAFDVVEEHQVDTLVVDNHNSVAAESGTLKANQISGLGMGSRRTIGGYEFNEGITYADLEALQVLLGSGVDTFTVDSTHHGRTEVSTGAGNDKVTVKTIDGHTRIDGGEGNDTFHVGSAGLVDLLAALLVIDGGSGTDKAYVDDSAEGDDQLATIAPDTLTGLDMIAPGGIDRMYSVTVRSGAATFTITLAGYGSTAPLAAGATAEQVQLALQTLLFPDAASCGLPDNDPDASTPLQDSRCAQSVYVWQHGATYFIGFAGEVGGVVGPVLSSSQTDIRRIDGISYFRLETFELTMGSGDDGVNVRGTSAATTVRTGAGDDLVFVSDAANLGNKADVLDAVDLSGLADWLAANADRDVEAVFEALLHGTVTIDDLIYHGSLDLIQGALSVDTGEGSNTLAVSDRGDTDADHGFVITAGTITGLSGGALGYTSTGGDLAGQGVWTQVADSGLFGRGISVFLGSGGNTGTIGSIRGGVLPTTPYGATVTTLYSGEGNDSVTITADAPTSGPARLVVHGQAGDDSILAAPTATQPLVLFGGAGADTLGGGAGDDLVFGDTGRVYHLLPGNVDSGYEIVFGGSPVAGHLTNPRTGATVPGDHGDGAFLTVDVLRTAETGVGDMDILSGRAGNDILLGGKGGDTIHGDAGNDLVLGDFGWVGALSGDTFVNTAQLPLSMPVHPFAFVSVDTTDVNGGNDKLYGGTGSDILLGQQGSDAIDGGDGDDDIIGGHNIAGGLDGGDFIVAGAGDDVIVGDNAEILRTGSALSTLVRELVGGRLYLLDPVTQNYYTGSSVTGDQQLDPTGVEVRWIKLLDHAIDTAAGLYGDDVVEAGAGDDRVFGQLGDDILHGGDGADYIEGNGGDDLIYGGLGQDDLIGGSSELFGLTTSAERPDGSDTIYGGNGNESTRNHAGDGSAAADADVMLGDNGNIYKIVRDGQFESFTYETQVIPRVVKHLDYTPTGEAGQHWLTTTDRARPVLTNGTATNIGAGDFLHGEDGNDVIHGMTGDDAIWGDAGDDDLYGQAGHDWVSGGTGIDGILGEDGLILTSRNGSMEPLNYVDKATVQSTVSSNGPHHSVVINATGTLTKAVDLEPFYVGYNDVLYGGLGNDFVHGGEGDDAISGGEALEAYYTSDPLATLALYYLDDNPLQFGYSDPDEFRYYDENNPMRLVMVCRTATDCLPFLTTADHTGNDGDDALFGDGGSDWISGGTGNDHLYGGWGNDLLDVDDDKTSNNGANSKPDNDKYVDYAFGGAGRDVLIANTKNDRLIDWIGEFNSYLVPFNPYGASTIWRASSPGMRQFLYDLSAADGADQTRTPVGERHGEPYGELGLTSSADAEWGDQHGAPGDPQPGNGGTFDDTMATTGTTSYSTSSFSTSFTTSTSPVISAGVDQKNKTKTTVTVNLRTKQTGTYRVLVQVAGLDGTLTTVHTLSIQAKSTSGTLSVPPSYLSGSLYEMLWMPSADPTQSEVTLVIRQLA